MTEIVVLKDGDCKYGVPYGFGDLYPINLQQPWNNIVIGVRNFDEEKVENTLCELQGYPFDLDSVCVTNKHVVVKSLEAAGFSEYGADAEETMRVRVWRLDDGARLFTLKGHGNRDGVGCVCVTPDGKNIVTGGCNDDATVRVWRIENGDCVYVLNSAGEVNSVCVTPDNKHIVAGSIRAAHVWRLDDGAHMHTLMLDRCARPVKVCMTNNDYVVLRSRDGDGDVNTLWGLVGGERLYSYEYCQHDDVCSAMYVTPDSKFLVTGSTDGTVRVWRPWGNGTISLVRTFEFLSGDDCCLTSVIMSPDKKYVIAQSGGTLFVWRLDDPLATSRCVSYEENFLGRGEPAPLNNLCFVTTDSKFVMVEMNVGYKFVVKIPLAKGRWGQLRRWIFHEKLLWWWWGRVWKPGSRQAIAAASEFGRMQGVSAEEEGEREVKRARVV